MKTRLRPLALNGVLYRWSLSSRIEGTANAEATRLRLRIWASDKASTPLLVELCLAQWGFIYVLPSEVRRLIEAGLASGWNPRQHGPTAQIALALHPDAVAPILARYPNCAVS